jgi:hypothetical protein
MSEQNGGNEPRPPAELTGAKLKADQTTIAIEATKDGKLRWPGPRISARGDVGRWTELF